MRGFSLHCGPAASMISLTAFLVGCEAQHAGAPTNQQTEQTASPSAPEFITAESEKVMSLRRQQVVTLTTLAGISLQQRLMRNGHSPRTVVRAGARPGEAGGYTYELGFAKDVDPNTDVLSESQGMLIVVEEADIPLLNGTVIDHESQPREGFRFDNPNAAPPSGGP